MTPSENRFFIHCGLILLILLLIPVVRVLVISDIPPPDDSDLTRPQVEIADERNAAILIDQHEAAADEATDEFFQILPDGLASDEDLSPELEEWLSRWQAEADAIEELLLRNDYVTPMIDSVHSVIPGIGSTLFILRAKTATIRLKIRDGHLDRAWREATDMLSIYQSLVAHDHPVVVTLAAGMLRRTALTEAYGLLQESNTDQTPAIQKFIATLLESPSIAEVGQRTFPVEYQFFKIAIRENLEVFELEDTVPKAARPIPGIVALGHKPNLTLSLYADRMRRHRDSMGMSWTDYTHATKDTQPSHDNPTLEYIVGAFTHGNPVGMAAVQFFTYSGFAKHIYAEQFRSEVLLTLLALQLYTWDHGQLPHSLPELVPDYLPAVPIDPFSLTPFEYDREARTLTADPASMSLLPRSGAAALGNPDMSAIDLKFIVPERDIGNDVEGGFD